MNFMKVVKVVKVVRGREGLGGSEQAVKGVKGPAYHAILQVATKVVDMGSHRQGISVVVNIAS